MALNAYLPNTWAETLAIEERFRNPAWEPRKLYYDLLRVSDGPLPEWVTLARPIGEPHLEFTLLYGTEFPASAVEPKYRVVIYDEARPISELPPCRLAVGASREGIEFAALGLAGLTLFPQIVGVDLGDVYGVAGYLPGFGKENQKSASNGPCSEGRAVVLPGLPLGQGRLSKMVKRRLETLARFHFDGGIFLHCLLGKKKWTKSTLQELDEFFDASVPLNRRPERFAATASQGASRSVVVAYAFKQF